MNDKIEGKEEEDDEEEDKKEVEEKSIESEKPSDDGKEESIGSSTNLDDDGKKDTTSLNIVDKIRASSKEDISKVGTESKDTVDKVGSSSKDDEGGIAGTARKGAVGHEDVKDTKSEDENKDDDEKSPGDDFLGENKKLDEIQNRQIKWAVYLMIGVILIIVVVPFINNNFINKFNYNGLVFQKTSLGDLVFYSTKFPVVKTTGQIIGDYAINFRNDPRDLEYIDVNVGGDRIKFVEIAGRGYTPVFISIDPFMPICDDSAIALLNLAGFLRDSGLKVKSAVTDEKYAKENNQKYMICENSKSNTVIMIKEGEESYIKEVGANCYEIIFKECEILQVSEKFMLVILDEYIGRFSKDRVVKEIKIIRGDVEYRYQNGTIETIINIKTLPNHKVIVKTLDPTPEEGETNVLEYFEKDSGFDGEVSVTSYPSEDLMDIVVYFERKGERVEVDGKTLHKFEGIETGGVIDLEIK